MPDLHLGLGPSPKPQFLYVSTEHFAQGWHFWDHGAGVPYEVGEPALTGYVRKVEVVERTRRGESKLKLDLHVHAGPRRYIVEAGLDTHFSRSMLAALARLQPRHFLRPLVVAVEPGTAEAKVVFGNLYDAETGVEIRGSDEARQSDPARLARRVQAAIEDAQADASGVPESAADGGEAA